jgi:hypothetical protein
LARFEIECLDHADAGDRFHEQTVLADVRFAAFAPGPTRLFFRE